MNIKHGPKIPGQVTGGAHERREEERAAVEHRRVHHLTLPRDPRLEQRTDDAIGKQQATAAEITDHVERGQRCSAGRSDRVQQTAEREVVDVVTRGPRQHAQPCRRQRDGPLPLVGTVPGLHQTELDQLSDGARRPCQCREDRHVRRLGLQACARVQPRGGTA